MVLLALCRVCRQCRHPSRSVLGRILLVLLAPLGTRETFVFSLGKSDRNVGAGGCWGVRPP